MDATWPSDLHELNELNFARFEAKLEQHMHELKAELIKWMFIFLTGSTFTILGVMVALLKF